jgi:hypothetical protein
MKRARASRVADWLVVGFFVWLVLFLVVALTAESIVRYAGL